MVLTAYIFRLISERDSVVSSQQKKINKKEKGIQKYYCGGET